MKFTDGFWQIRSGIRAHFATQVHEVKLEPDALVVYAATRPINHRGDTLGMPLLTIRFSSPIENVIRVQIAHFTGVQPCNPEFRINRTKPPKVKITNTPQAATLTSGQVSVRVSKSGGWKVEFIDGKRSITNSGWKNLGYIETQDGNYIHEQLALGVGECVYGLGERFTPFVKNGQIVEIWNQDGGTSSEQAYKNIPFYITNRGYGVFVNHPELVSFEVASEKVERVQFSVSGESLDYYLIYGPEPKEVLNRYTALTGRPALPPAWSFGLWLTTSFVTDYDEKTVTGFIQGMAKRDIPLSVFHFDCFWMKEMHWCNFEWDNQVFPDPKGMLKRLKSRGIKICVWINPYIAQRSALFDEGKKKGFLLKRPNGDVWQTDQWQSGMGIVDFTNPDACKWFGDKLRALLDMGVDCFKTDFGEKIPTEEVAYFDQSDPVKMHNLYTYLYNQTVFEVLEGKLGKGQATVFARSATVGGQQFPVHWGGDSTATFESMAETLRGGLSLGLSGFGFWSHDIGGFEQTAGAEVYKRWCAFGLLSSHSRLHGNSSYRVPWLFDEEAVDVLRYFTKLKCRLMPYLFAKAVEAHETGTPMLRAMILEFPNDPGCDALDRQYMLGESLLVAPVFSKDGKVDVYIPEGKWTHLLTGKVVEGPRWYRERYDFFGLPLYVRPNTVLAIGKIDTKPDYAYADGVTFEIYQFEDNKKVTATVPDLYGKEALKIEVTRNGKKLNVIATKSGALRIRLVGIKQVICKDATIQSEPKGILVIPAKDSKRISIEL
ncbi:MAG: alpha-xylosidase [bacterium]